MRARHFRPISFVIAALAALAGCSSASETVASSEAADTEGTDDWGPSLSLRDDTGTTPNAPPGGFYVTPIHTTLMPNGKLLVTGWGRAQQDTCVFPEGSRSHGTTFVLDPAQLAGIAAPGPLPITPINEQAEQTPNWSPDVLYCVGQVQTKDGILYTGGSRYQALGVRGSEAEVGLSSARVFDYSTGALRRLPARMQGGPAAEPIKSRPQYGPVDKRGWRWYPTNTRLSDGRILVSGGFSSLESPNYAIEIFDPTSETFSTLVQHDDPYPPIREAVAPGLKDYTHTFLLPQPVSAANGGGRERQIAMMGWQGRVVLMSTDANVPSAERFTTRPHAARPGGNGGTGAAWDASAALVSTGELFVLGGTNDPNVAKRADLYNPATDSWTQIDTGIGRRNAASVLLPDGKVLLMGGWDEDGNLPGDRRQPQVVDPVTKKVTTYPAWTNDPYERGYHSFAILLKDASVLIGGGISPKVNGVEKSSIGCERNDIRIYRPAYLTKGPRPVIDAAEPIDLELGSASATSVPFHGAPLAANGGAVLMALGATTHSFDQNQRYVPVEYHVDGGTVAVTPPSDPVKAPDGDYLLFLVSDAGAPSEGKHVRLRHGADPQAMSSVVTFKVDNATTTFGTNVFVLGDAAELGAWDPAHAIPLSPTAYPTWSGKVTLPRGKQVALKFIKRDAAGNTTWESGANRAWTVPSTATSDFSGTWN